jgi:hypothetical protein
VCAQEHLNSGDGSKAIENKIGRRTSSMLFTYKKRKHTYNTYSKENWVKWLQKNKTEESSPVWIEKKKLLSNWVCFLDTHTNALRLSVYKEHAGYELNDEAE